MKKELLFVDGYNMIGAWPELVRLKNAEKMADARDLLLHELSNYAKYEGIEVRVVFDAQFVPGIQQTYRQYTLSVIFTGEGETADSFIEKAVGEENLLITNVTVATSDLAEQWIVFQKGANRKSAHELYKDIKRTKKTIQVDAALYQMHQRRRNSPLKEEDEKKLKEFYQHLIERDQT
jgi:hypothetical protein